METINEKGPEVLTARSVLIDEGKYGVNTATVIAPLEPCTLALPEYGLDALSFCTGIGGLDCAAEQSNMRVLMGSDIWTAAEKNYPLNFGGDFLLGDMLDLNGDEILERVNRSRGELGCVFAGCPCPGVSGLNRKRNSLYHTNILMFKYINLVSKIEPMCFVLEQVSGLGDKEVLNALHEIKMRFKEDLKNYVIQCRAVRTLYLSVPQDRTRWIFVGWHRSTGMLPVFPKPVKGSLAHLTIGAIAPEIDYLEIKGSRILRKENTEFFPTVPASEHVLLKMKDGSTQKLSNRPDLLLKVFGYPEGFKIHPDLSYAQIHRLIGNSVPPPMAKAVFTEIVRQLRSLRSY